MSARLEGKVCVITGAAGGIGAATAAVFEREAAHVVGVDLREHHIGELSLRADLTDEQAVASFARHGVRVNALCPGPVETPLLRDLYAEDPEQAARRLVHVPMGRFAHPEEIAAAVLFLASDESSYVNATSFLVDGGISGAYTTAM